VRVGSIAVTTTPPKATVHIDDVQYPFPTPTVVTDVVVGPHTVKLTLYGYAEHSEPVDVEEGKQSTVLWAFSEIPEEIIAGSIAVRSLPTGATIFVDGKQQPFPTNTVIREVPLGLHVVDIDKDGYERHTEKVTLTKEKPDVDVYSALTMKPAKIVEGTLKVASNPVNVTVSTAGIMLGTTDDTGVLSVSVEPGMKDLLMEKSEYESETRTVLIKPNETTQLYVILGPVKKTKKAWRVDFSATDELGNALHPKVLVNGSFTGKWAPDYVLLNPGTYTFEFQLAGYETAEKEITLREFE
jgi:hypothetical protein